MAVVFAFQTLSSRMDVLLLLLLLLQPSQSDPVLGLADTVPEGRHQNSPAHLARQHVLDGPFPRHAEGHRQKRQAFDFSMSTLTPKPSTTKSDTSTVPSVTHSQGDTPATQGLSLQSTTPPADTAATPPRTTTPCFGWNMCHMGYQCENGGTCVYNTSTCLVSCRCPPPYNDPQLYSQISCRPLGTPSNNQSSATTPTTSASHNATTTAPGCFGLNTCDLGFRCENGGTCYYNTTTCKVRCLCPPPYDDPQLYNQITCGLLPTHPPPPSSSLRSDSPGLSSTAPHPAPPTTTLRPIAERQCRDATCIHGYCNTTDFTRDPCRCDPGWKGFFCDVGCFKQCANGGRCVFFNYPLNKEKCMCMEPWTGDNCTERKPEPQEQDQALVHWLSGSFAVGLVVLMTLGAVFMFYLWRKRLVFALKVVYYFLPYEDNDGREYDAFVSYVLEDTDEQFVHNTLRPKLENEMGFNLCLHQRDFPVGGVISENILDALENSRRFILVLTPSYLKNEWAEFEFQRAFHEMLKRKLRIIPVILEDITPCPEDALNPTLKTILESVALLNYPPATANDRKLHKFWKQLRLCMPKRKKKEDTDDKQKDGVTKNGGDVTLTQDDVHVTVV